MNREIKFRVWDSDLKKMRYLNSTHDIIEFDEKGIGQYHNLQTGYGEWFGDLMQYTGLKDKNGKEIYEGDIVKCFIDDEYHDLIVEYDCGAFSTTYHKGDLYKISDYLYRVLTKNYNEDYEVIGNIYESEVENNAK